MEKSFHVGDLIVVTDKNHKHFGKVARIYGFTDSVSDFGPLRTITCIAVDGGWATDFDEKDRLPGTAVFAPQQIDHYRKGK